MTLQRVAIIGAGGFAREVLDIFDAINETTPRHDVVGYIVESVYGEPGTLVNDKPILGDFDYLEGRERDVSVICGVGAPEIRSRLIRRAAQMGLRFCNVIHPSVVMSRWVAVGAGSVIAAGCVLTNQIRLGDHVHINLDCTVGHDAVFEDFSTLAPGVHVSGNVTCEEGSCIGTGVNILPGMRIGAWSIVGAGAMIGSDVPPNSTVVGVPGRVVSTRDDGWHLKQGSFHPA